MIFDQDGKSTTDNLGLSLALTNPDGATANVAVSFKTTADLRLPGHTSANLRVGDVIFLDQQVNELVEMHVCGRPRFKARPGLNGQTVALELVEPYSENKHE